MKIAIYFLSAAVVFLIIWVWRVWTQFVKIRKDFDRFEYKMRIMEGRLKQAEGKDLDLAVIEEQEEENIQKLFDFIRQEIGGAKGDIRDLEERMESLSEDVETQSEKITEIEEIIEEKEDENQG